MKTNKEKLEFQKLCLELALFHKERGVEQEDTVYGWLAIFVQDKLSDQKKKTIASVDYAIEGLENTILLCDDKHTIHNLKNNVLRPLKVLLKEDE